jgi:hypothetical protein
MLKVGICHYTGEILISGLKMDRFPHFQWNTKCPGVFLRLATVATSVIMDFKTFAPKDTEVWKSPNRNKCRNAQSVDSNL